MTKQEAIVLSAFTDTMLCDFDDYQTYVEKILGSPVMTNELRGEKMKKSIKEAARADAMAILNNLE